MTLRYLMIGGTGAPPQSKLYYKPILDVAEEFVNKADFESIFMLGLGDIKGATVRIGEKYFDNSNDHFIVCGHSQGAIIASLLAIWYPERVLAVIAIAGPYKGTAWTDPVNMPIRGFVEAVTRMSGGRVRLKPALRRFIVPIIPIVRDLAAHSEISEEILLCLETQIGGRGHETHAFIGSSDMFVFPHRSANPVGPNVTNYIVAPMAEYQRIASVLPDDLVHIDAHAGHISIISCAPVLQRIREIMQSQVTILAQL
jgi:hypothetical protein